MFVVETLEGRELFAVSTAVTAPPPSNGILIGLLLPAVQKVPDAVDPSDPSVPTGSLNVVMCDGSVRVG